MTTAHPIVLTSIESPLGPLVAGAHAQGICLLEFSEPDRVDAQVDRAQRRIGTAAVPGDSRHLESLRAALAAYFDGRLRAFTLPLVAPGTPFQERVWAELLRIPYGETRSYEELARRVGAPGAQRAVGQANGLNRIAILIPCHRIVNKNGSLGGYGGQLWRKRALLDLERTGQLSLH
jgi:AraC family transcriptional regulator of adaptative response/methylated-DNA-[protein]-cysteine methyltransferase